MQRPAIIDVYKCLCDETRLRIVHLLAGAPLCVCHLQEVLGLGQVAVSKHLAYLRKHGLVATRRHGQWMIYSLPSAPSRELDWQLRCLKECLPSHPLFRDDLKKLKKLEPDCCWVADAACCKEPAAGKKLKA